MPNDEVLKLPEGGICPEPLIFGQTPLGKPMANWGQACIMEKCGKYQACKVLPETMKKVLETLLELEAR